MHDNDSFRLVDPDEAVAVAVALIALVGFADVLVPERVPEAPAAVVCQCNAGADYAGIVAQVLSGPVVINVGNKPAASCRVIRSKT